MKIVCDNCATKYSIADEKVRGKVFKIRCKKCSHIIVVRGASEAADPAHQVRGAGADAGASAGGGPGPGADGGAGGDEVTVAAGSMPAIDPAADLIWHLVVDREQVGPLTAQQVRAKLAAGEVDAESYAWREGFSDWVRLASIDEFAHLTGAMAPAATSLAQPSAASDLFGSGGGEPSPAPGGDMFGHADDAGFAAPAPAASGEASGADELFGAAGGGLFGAPAAAPAPRGGRPSSPGMQAVPAAGLGGMGAESTPIGESKPMMTGQRNENSVLFSLSNLQALATGSTSPKPAEPKPGFANSQNEGSGLIDIRAMAASTMASSAPTSGSRPAEDLPSFSGPQAFAPMNAPLLLPTAPAGPPKWVWAFVVSCMVLLVVIVLGGVWWILRTKPEVSTVALPVSERQGPAVPAPVPTHAPPGTAVPPPAAAAPATGKPGEPAKESVAVDDAEARNKARHSRDRGSKSGKPGRTEAPAAAPPTIAAVSPPTQPAATAPRKSSKRDELDELLNTASPDSRPRHSAAAPREDAPAARAADDNLPEVLDKDSIKGAMAKVRARVNGCYDQFKVAGMVTVSVTVGRTGRVQSASISGPFAGTPTGDCVAKAVRSASFPPFKSASQTFQYPYVLR